GFWGVVPALGVEAFANAGADLATRLVEAIRLEFNRSRRLQHVQRIVSAIWFDAIELQRRDLALQIPTPKDLENSEEQSQEAFLPKLAEPLQIQQRVVYGRKKELDQLIRAVKTGFNRNVLLVGPTGVGKTALIWEMVRQRKKRRIENTVWETTASTMVKELTGETGWEDNLAFLCRELAQSGDFLFIRNLLDLFEVGQYEGNTMSMAEYLAGFISRGEINVLSECTEEEMARIELRSPNFIPQFQVIRLEEPVEEMEDIVINKVNDLAKKQGIDLEQSAIEETIRLNRRFTPYAGFPGKPIRFLESLLIAFRQSPFNQNAKGKYLVDRTQVVKSFCEETGMPLFMVDPAIPMEPEKIKSQFNEQVFGQEKAVESVVNLLASVKTALTRSGKPIASFLFVGPTGVGKTEMAKQLAAFTFGNRDRMIRFDMSEYSSAYAVSRLIGDQFFTDGLLTSAVRRSPFCLLLFDEIEKADSSFYDLLLQILGEGRLTDSRGKLVNFCSTIIIMTSNIGAANLQSNRISWQQDVDAAEISSHFMNAVEKHFRPELFNRIDQIIPFEPLSRATVRFVVDREINLFKQREGIRFRRMDLQIEPEVLDFLGEKGYDHKYGARQLQRTIRELLIIPLSRALNVEDADDQLLVNIFVAEESIQLTVEADPLGLELLLEELDKINYADYASELRRQMYRFREGHFYVRLLSEIDILEREKKRKKEVFFKNKAKAEQYTFYLQLREKVGQLTQVIEQYESDMSLATLELIPFQPSLFDQLKTWEKDFFDLKLEIYTRRNPEAAIAHMGFYGSNIHHIVNFYLDLCQAKGFQCELQAVWFREAHYNEEVVLTDVDGKGNSVERKSKRQEYVKSKVPAKKGIEFKKPQKGDQLYGVEMKVVGTCSFLYLKEEEGPHRWKISDKEIYNYVVQVSAKAIETPTNIHRKEFYKHNPRRIIEAIHFKDNRLKINREVARGKHQEQLIELLDNDFVLKLNSELM
ncbi:MAG: AAA family ATPase, partial [Bacteroidota bacterium]